MSINVYWACYEDEWIRSSEPEKVSERFYKQEIISKDKNSPIALNYCPAFNKQIQNLYAIKSIYDYSFFIQNDICTSNMYDQSFFDKHLNIRSIEKKFFSFRNKYIFFTDQKSLNMTAYEYPLFEQNEISQKCIPVSGQYDIGKWFRPLEFPFILKNEFDSLEIKYQDVLYYLRFYTNKKINFKQFIINNKIENMINSTVASTYNHNQTFKNLENFYKMFKGKDYILNEIKQNLV
jgi:hypothetical protein